MCDTNYQQLAILATKRTTTSPSLVDKSFDKSPVLCLAIHMLSTLLQSPIQNLKRPNEVIRNKGPDKSTNFIGFEPLKVDKDPSGSPHLCPCNHKKLWQQSFYHDDFIQNDLLQSEGDWDDEISDDDDPYQESNKYLIDTDTDKLSEDRCPVSATSFPNRMYLWRSPSSIVSNPRVVPKPGAQRRPKNPKKSVSFANVCEIYVTFSMTEYDRRPYKTIQERKARLFVDDDTSKVGVHRIDDSHLEIQDDKNIKTKRHCSLYVRFKHNETSSSHL